MMTEDDIKDLVEGVDYAIGRECKTIREIYDTEIGEMIVAAIEAKVQGLEPTEMKDILKRMSLFIVERRKM
jgi:hypothetical protein